MFNSPLPVPPPLPKAYIRPGFSESLPLQLHPFLLLFPSTDQISIEEAAEELLEDEGWTHLLKRITNIMVLMVDVTMDGIELAINFIF